MKKKERKKNEVRQDTLNERGATNIPKIIITIK